MRRVIIIVLALNAFAGIGFLALRGCATPEERVRARLLRCAEDFDDGRAGPCARVLAGEFLDETSGADAQLVAGALFRMTLSDREPGTNVFLHRVDLPLEAMEIVIDPADPARAHVDLVAVFEELRDGQWRLEWRVAISADMADGKDGWKVHRTTHETLEGNRP
jgi:hypothetical protein